MPSAIVVILPILFMGFAEAQQVNFETYSIQDGLVANQVRKVAQDTHGFIWIATWEGVSKYDGYRFTNFNTENGLGFDLINDIYVDDDNQIYVAENNGRIDVIEHDQLLSPLADSVVVNSFIKVDDTVFIITDNYGIGTINSGNLHTSNNQTVKSILDFVRVNDSLFLVLDPDYKAILLDANFNPFSYDQSGTVYQSLSVDSKNNIWLCGHDQLKLLHPVQQRNQPIQFLPLPDLFRNPILQGRDIYNLFEDQDHNYWISTVNGLIRLTASGRFQIFTTNNGLPANLVTNLFQDREKNIWLCSQLGLVKLVMKNDFQFFINEIGAVNQGVSGFAKAEPDFFYFNSGRQIFKMNFLDFSLVPYSPVSGYNFIIRHPRSEGLIAMSTGRVLEILEQTKVRTLASVPGNPFLHAIPDHRDNIFISSYDGVYFRSSSGAVQHFALEDRITTMILDDENYLWAGTWEDGLYRIKILYSPNPVAIQVENLTDFVASKNIRSLFMDSFDNLWMGTRYHGVIRLSRDSEKGWSLLRYGKEQGLSSNWIFCINEDFNKNIWVGTHSGLNKLIPVQDHYQIFNFSHVNNYFGEIHNIYTTADGYLWCSGFSGLVRFQDDQVDTIPVPPAVITSAKVGDKKISIFDSNPRLKYYSGIITFEFSAPTFLNENGINYSYRLLGAADTLWSHPLNHHTISYSGLEPGAYHFEVKPYGLNKLPGDITRFSFSVTPPYWKTWWFSFIVFFLLFLLGFAMYRYRLQQLIKWQKARDRIATDLHDEIGSSLTNINILSELSHQHLHQPQQVEKFLLRISEEVQSSGQAMDDIIWSVNSQHDTLEETLARMRRFTSELFDSSNTEYHLELDERIKSRKLNMEQRRDIFLMYKEILNNISKHAKAKEVWITAQLISQQLRLQIKDNGKGFKVGTVTHRNGLKNIYHRTQKWNGKITIDSKEKEGTSIDISLPLKE